jgi:hypothetical protein
MSDEQYPHGKISHDDDGSLDIAVAADPGYNVVRIEFGKEVSWLALDVESAERFVALLEQKIDDLKAGSK